MLGRRTDGRVRRRLSISSSMKPEVNRDASLLQNQKFNLNHDVLLTSLILSHSQSFRYEDVFGLLGSQQFVAHW